MRTDRCDDCTVSDHLSAGALLRFESHPLCMGRAADGSTSCTAKIIFEEKQQAMAAFLSHRVVFCCFRGEHSDSCPAKHREQSFRVVFVRSAGLFLLLCHCFFQKRTGQTAVFAHRFHHLSAVPPAGYMVAHNRGKSHGNGSRKNG